MKMDIFLTLLLGAFATLFITMLLVGGIVFLFMPVSQTPQITDNLTGQDTVKNESMDDIVYLADITETVPENRDRV